jgi:hypothetical protein
LCAQSTCFSCFQRINEIHFLQNRCRYVISNIIRCATKIEALKFFEVPQPELVQAYIWLRNYSKSLVSCICYALMFALNRIIYAKYPLSEDANLSAFILLQAWINPYPANVENRLSS